jgi:hypothetical protein
MEAGWDDLGPITQGQQRLRTGKRLVSDLSRIGEQAEGPELVLDEVADVFGDDGSIELFARLHSHTLEVALAIEAQEDEVEQVGQMEDLAVAATDQVVRLMVSRALVLPQQFGALGQSQRADCRGRRSGHDTC